MISLSVLPKKKVLRFVKTLNFKDTLSGRLEELDKNYIVFVNSLICPYRSQPMMVHGPNLPSQSQISHLTKE
jgi:hypothetical protein